MTSFTQATPQCTVHLFKTIARTAIDGTTPVSSRYQGKDDYIDLTTFLSDGSAVRTSKSVREPAGGFSISFADQPQGSGSSLETLAALIEPMDMIEIRMWGGVGAQPAKLPIIMRGFVTNISRKRSMSQEGKPQRQVTVTGQDYGKIWQIIQVIHLAAYSEGKALLTSFALSEIFGASAVNSMKAGDFVSTMIDKIVNPQIAGMMPDFTELPSSITIGDDISVAHGMVNQSYQNMQGSIYDILAFHGDVGIWNELYLEDREDGVHVVYRPTPALLLTQPDGASSRKIQDDAPDPVYVEVPDDWIVDLAEERSDAGVANFFWVNNSRFDLIDDMQRRLAAISSDSSKVSLKDYSNAAPKYYGLRAMNAATQQGGDEVSNQTSGLPAGAQAARTDQQESWIDKRRRIMLQMNQDNVVYEHGAAVIKGGPMRDDGVEAMKAGDYARFMTGNITYDAYVYQIDHEFMPYASYLTSLIFDRGEGFAVRAQMESGTQSPYLAEQIRRSAGV